MSRPFMRAYYYNLQNERKKRFVLPDRKLA